ncbi:hypothetical protein [Bradyrhizobium sp. BWC-3-1]|uniref:hypothetical protein n=1 Tax=Bradyrhizobium sp. BWC-3-1 TaxID=3080012 RepID=UPI00293ED366|nr:hypothetical protein [Bradyrhizobium sp. BWC-3-1]WOH61911.1 hypothetical protein RX329_18190 [Bradyrhizobium sp. BWC-3-1]
MKTANIKLTAAIVVDGKIAKAGSIIEAPEDHAKGLILRGKAELATVADEAPAEVEADEVDGEDKPKAKAKK